MNLFRRVHFTWLHLVTAYISTHLNLTYTVRHGLNKGMKRKGGLGFVPFESETAETMFFRNLDLDGKVVYDIGAFEGLMSLYFASRGAQVIAFEPNPRNYNRCLENIALNGLNVRVLQYGVSDEPGVLELAYDPLLPGAGSAESGVRSQIAAMDSARKIDIPVIRIDDLLPGPSPDFIKIDIEGMEAHALRGMKETLARYKPAVYVELHGADRPSKEKIASDCFVIMEVLGYRVYDVENARYVSSFQTPPSHIYCTAT